MQSRSSEAGSLVTRSVVQEHPEPDLPHCKTHYSKTARHLPVHLLTELTHVTAPQLLENFPLPLSPMIPPPGTPLYLNV